MRALRVVSFVSLGPLFTIYLSLYYCPFYGLKCVLPPPKLSFPGGSDGKEPACHVGDLPGFSSWLGKIPWKREWQPTPIFLPGDFSARRILKALNLSGMVFEDGVMRMGPSWWDECPYRKRCQRAYSLYLACETEGSASASQEKSS